MKKVLLSLLLLTFLGLIFTQDIQTLSKTIGAGNKGLVPCSTQVKNKKEQCSSLINAAGKSAQVSLSLFARLSIPNKTFEEKRREIDNIIVTLDSGIKIATEAAECIKDRRDLQKNCIPICKRRQYGFDKTIEEMQKEVEQQGKKRCQSTSLQIEDLQGQLEELRDSAKELKQRASESRMKRVQKLQSSLKETLKKNVLLDIQ